MRRRGSGHVHVGVATHAPSRPGAHHVDGAILDLQLAHANVGRSGRRFLRCGSARRAVIRAVLRTQAGEVPLARRTMDERDLRLDQRDARDL